MDTNGDNKPIPEALAECVKEEKTMGERFSIWQSVNAFCRWQSSNPA
jgi:hypothetical protein